MFGVVFAAVQSDMKRLLAYSSIENIGIIVAGIGLAILFKAYAKPLLAAMGKAVWIRYVLVPGLTDDLADEVGHERDDQRREHLRRDRRDVVGGHQRDQGLPLRARSP